MLDKEEGQNMWKESYRIGIDRIDDQHIQLFKMADELLSNIEKGAEKQKFAEAVTFMKDYVVYHFKDEEEYQQSIDYSGIEEHKKAHRNFTNTVLTYEKRLIETDFDIRVLKDLAGTLTAWLIYHVADSDQKIAKGNTAAAVDLTGTFIGSFCAAIEDVLEKMAGIPKDQIVQEKAADDTNDSVRIRIDLTGDARGSAIFDFSKEFAFNMVKNLTFMEVDTVDEMVFSVLAEISNIVSGNAATEITARGFSCDIRPPRICDSHEDAGQNGQPEGVELKTSMGGIGIWTDL